MAKFYAFERATSKIVTLDTVNAATAATAVGSALSGVDALATFDARGQNIIATFKGDPYAMVRMAAGTVNVFKYSSSSWSQVASFTTTLNPSVLFTLHPVSLQVINDTIVATFYEVGVTKSGMTVRTSTDGAAWAAGVGSGLAATSTFGYNGSTTVWRNTLWASSGEGILGRVISPAAWVGGVNVADTGTDAGLGNALTQSGDFAHWNGDLYFIRPDTTSPRLYKLPASYSHSSVGAVAGWVNQAATGIPAPGALAVNYDQGTYALFTNPQDELCLLTNGANGIKLSKTTAATFPAFTDLTVSLLPTTLSGLTAATTIGVYEDDRRRTNELHTLLFRTGTTTYVANWDGASAVSILSTLTSTTALIPNAQKADYRTETVGSVVLTAVTQPFPGQVQIVYSLKDASSRTMAISPEYSADGDVWSAMTEDSGDGMTGLTSSPAGVSHTFRWSAHSDLTGDYSYMQMRIVARITSA